MDLSKRLSQSELATFVGYINDISDGIGFRVSARGWGYILEQKGIITKDQFNKVEDVINKCRKNGMLPVDFVAEEDARAFKEIHEPSTDTLEGHVKRWLEAAMTCDRYFEPDWWKGEKYYIQMVVEKIDLVTLFQPICARFHIPIANSKGWSSILQRAEYCRRFREAEENGLKCVLLYCGDHDPDGLRISETLRKNLNDVSTVVWSDGTEGYDPSGLLIERFGLNYDFIIANRLTWIDNLITGSGKDLASKQHPNHDMPYVRDYLRKVGERKCEANSVVIVPEMGQRLCEETILRYLGDDAESRFRAKRAEVRESIVTVMDRVGVKEAIEGAIDSL
jgi:hypothetical protein